MDGVFQLTEKVTQVVRTQETTSVTPVTVFTFTMDNNTACGVYIDTAVKRTSGGETSAAIDFHGKVQRRADGTYNTQSPNLDQISTISPVPVISYTTSGGNVLIQVQSGSAITVQWTLHIKIVKT